jgi:hypothetical protein
MTTVLDKTVKCELLVKGRPFVISISPQTLKITAKGRRKGLELRWEDLVSGDAALAVALNASLGQLIKEPAGETAAKSPRRGRSPGRARRSG